MITQVNVVFFLTASDVLITRLRMRHLHIQFQLSDLGKQKWKARIPTSSPGLFHFLREKRWGLGC